MRFVLLTVAVLAAAAQPAQRPPDFAFRLEYGCLRNTLDTFQGKFGRDMEPLVSIALAVPPDVLDKMYQTVMAARFVEYPSNYHEPPTNGFRFPAHYYFLDLRMDGVRHTVRWSEPVSPYTDAGLRLEQMFKSIIRIVEALPEVQRLPLPKDACL